MRFADLSPTNSEANAKVYRAGFVNRKSGAIFLRMLSQRQSNSFLSVRKVHYIAVLVRPNDAQYISGADPEFLVGEVT